MLLLVTVLQVTAMDRELRHIVEVLTVAHVLAAAPMLFALATGRSLPTVSRRVRGALGLAAVLAVVVVSGVFAFGLDPDGVSSAVE